MPPTASVYDTHGEHVRLISGQRRSRRLRKPQVAIGRCPLVALHGKYAIDVDSDFVIPAAPKHHVVEIFGTDGERRSCPQRRLPGGPRLERADIARHSATAM